MRAHRSKVYRSATPDALDVAFCARYATSFPNTASGPEGWRREWLSPIIDDSTGLSDWFLCGREFKLLNPANRCSKRAGRHGEWTRITNWRERRPDLQERTEVTERDGWKSVAKTPFSAFPWCQIRSSFRVFRGSNPDAAFPYSCPPHPGRRGKTIRTARRSLSRHFWSVNNSPVTWTVFVQPPLV